MWTKSDQSWKEHLSSSDLSEPSTLTHFRQIHFFFYYAYLCNVSSLPMDSNALTHIALYLVSFTAS